MYYYDLYMSVGPACRPARHLLENVLRIEAYPLDWQMAYSLDTVIYLFKTKFDDFFVNIEEDNERGGAPGCRRIKDLDNNIISIHHFPLDIGVYEAQNDFIAKMKKRFYNLDKKLKESKKIAIISNRSESIERLKSFLEEFSVLYTNLEIRLINIRTDEKRSSYSYEQKLYSINEKLSIIEYCFNDTFDSTTKERYDWKGNIKIWSEILKTYHNNTYMTFKEKHKSIVIYGAGRRCSDILNMFNKCDISIKGIAVSDIRNNPSKIGTYNVDLIEKYDEDDFIIISIADKDEALKIKDSLIQKGYNNLTLYNKNTKIFLE